MGRFDNIQAQLQNLTTYKWGRKQSDDWDKKTRFIYKQWRYERMEETLQELFPEDNAAKNYARARWYNFWSAMSVEAIFGESDRVVPAENQKDRLKDFFIDGIPFDHKTTVFPYAFDQPVHVARESPIDLITWLYKNQSQQGRMHWGNRLFLVMHNRRGDNWKLKGRINWLQGLIHQYLRDFKKEQLTEIKAPNGASVLSDVLWCVAEE